MKLKLNKHVKEHLLTILTMISVVLGIVAGIAVRSVWLRDDTDKFPPRTVMYVRFIGNLFLRILKSLILPLIVSSLIAAVGSLDISLSKRIGTRAIFYYLVTTIMAVILGIVLVVIIRPGGDGLEVTETTFFKKPESRPITTADTLLDLVRNIFPPNLVQATIQQSQTLLIPPAGVVNGTMDEMMSWEIKEQYINGMNIMGLVVSSIVFGIAIASARAQTKNLQTFFNELSQTMMRITGWVIWLSPIGVFFLILSELMEMQNIIEVFTKLGLYFVTVSVGIIIHGFLVLPTIFFVITRRNPFRFVANMGQAIATAFATSSSSATLPVTIQCIEQKNFVDSKVSRFVLPIGSTINMDGTALYEAVAAIFIAQLRGVSLTLNHIVAISITATAASIGAAGIPQAGLVTLVMVLDAVGLPAQDVSLILAVDWMLDRLRTVINVLGDAFGAAIVEHFSIKELKAMNRAAYEDPVFPEVSFETVKIKKSDNGARL